MGVLDNNTLLGASAASEYEIEQSLRFDDGRTTYLSRTPSAAGNRKTYTLSAWIKFGEVAAFQYIAGAPSASGNNQEYIQFGTTSSSTIRMFQAVPSVNVATTALLRDNSAWYHVVFKVDTTQSTAANRVKIYINGVDQLLSATTYPAQNANTNWNTTAANGLGSRGDGDGYYDGYLAEVNFIDGQALTPDSFGETGTYGEWLPTKYAGTYGTNGFYLPFKQDYSVEGFSTVVYEANTQVRYIGGVGFQPDFLWFKNRTRSGTPHRLVDTLRGLPKTLSSDTTGAEATGLSDGTVNRLVTGVTADGFTLGIDDGGYRINSASGDDIVAWTWDMGGTTASNTSGTINSSVRANTTYRQSIVTYSANGSSGTIGHGLGAVPTMIIVKKRNAAERWCVFHTSTSNAYIYLNETFAAETGNADDRFGNNTSVVQPTSSVFSVGQSNDVNGSSGTYVAYCFSDVAGYSKHGSFTGNNSTSNVITTGFAPAFVMIKNTESTYRWYMFDNTRDPNNPAFHRLFANNNDVESTNSNVLEFTSTGFKIITTDAEVNQSGKKMLYMAFADTREYAYWLDQSGNNNDWTSEGGLTESDVMLDSPTNNFATLNPLDKSGTVTLSEGNLKYVNNTGVVRGTIAAGAGSKFYLEYCQVSAINSSNPIILGIGTTEGLPAHESAHVQSMVVQCDGNSQKRVRVFVNNAQVQTTSFNALAAINTGGILMFAYDGTTGKAWVGINGSWLQGNPATGASPIYTFSNTASRPMTAFVDHAGASHTGVLNFGQDSSFAGFKTPQGNQDSSGTGDFYYAPSTGFLALCTKSLPSVDVIPTDNFNTVLYTGNGSNQSITTGLPADLVWVKSRSSGAYYNTLFDTMRGTLKRLFSNTNGAEDTTANTLTAFNSNGFTLGSQAGQNAVNVTYVSWNWKAGGGASSNSNGTVNSSVSANVDAGFSIVSYTGNGANDGTGINSTVGHGLSQKPEVIIRKDQDNAANWVVYHASLGTGNGNLALFLNTTNGQDSGQGFMNNTAPTSTVFTLGNQTFVNVSGRDYISYCFHSVDGYSKFGKYIGNNNADGTFVHLGFKAKFIMIKEAITGTGNGEWQIFDTARSPVNVVDDLIAASTSGAESVGNTYQMLDILSNGFKLRSAYGTSSQINYTTTYVYLAFAESPFKNSNAR